MSQIEIKIDGRVFNVGEEKILEKGNLKVPVRIYGYNAGQLMLQASGHTTYFYCFDYEIDNLKDITSHRTVSMTYEDLRDLVALEKGGVEFERNDGSKFLCQHIMKFVNGETIIWGNPIESFRCYRLYSENWAVEHPLTKEVD